MDNSKYCHLHNHSTASLLDGLGLPEKLASKAKEMGFLALGLTDHGNVDCAIKFYNALKTKNIKPVIGAELYFVDDIYVKPKKETRYHLTALCKNIDGFHNLMKMLTIANSDGFHRRPRIDLKILERYGKDLVVLSGCSMGIVAKGDYDLILKMKDLYHEDFYFEIMPHNYAPQILMNNMCYKLSKELKIPLVSTNDSHYIEEKDSVTQEVLLAIQTGSNWNNPKRWKFEFTGLYMRSLDDMIAAYKNQKCDIPEDVLLNSLYQTIEIADKCDVKIEKKKIDLPLPPCLVGKDENEELLDLCMKGWKDRFDFDIDDEKGKIYYERLIEELATIEKLGFVRYFLLVWELIDWCKNDQKMYCGYGRGSSAGSFICFLLKITEVDPIKYKLLFSRFISDARIDLPDIDMDFPDDQRHLVKKHLEEIYGKQNVASVSTFSHFHGKMAIRDVSRVFDIPRPEVDKCSKAIIVRSGGDSRCLAGDTIIYTCDDGPQKISLLVGKGRIRIAKLNGMKRESIEAEAVFSGTRELFELETESGRKIKSSAEHMFWTDSGWKRLCELKLNKNLLFLVDESSVYDKCLYCGKNIYRYKKANIRQFCNQSCNRKYFNYKNNPMKKQEARDNCSKAKTGKRCAWHDDPIKMENVERLSRERFLINNPMSNKKTVEKMRKTLSSGVMKEVMSRPEERKKRRDAILERLRKNPDLHPLRIIAKRKRDGRQINGSYISDVQIILYSMIKKYFEKSEMEYPVRKPLLARKLHTREWYFLDIAIPELKINIEYDGFGHFDSDKKRVKKDIERDMFLKDLGWRVFRFDKNNLDYDKISELCLKWKNTRKEKIISIKFIGMCASYDMMVYHKKHRGFLANGIQVHNSSFSVIDSCQTLEDAKKFKLKYPHVIDHASVIEGEFRNKGVHAAGIVVSSEPLNDGMRCVLQYPDNESTINWDKYDLEQTGLMKLDVLGLNTLSVLQHCRYLVKEIHKIDLDLYKLEPDDPKVFEEFSKGNNIGIFQMGSLGLRKFSKSMGINNFNDLVDLNSLHRPSGLRSGVIDDYDACKKGRKKPVYYNSEHERITKATYGLVIYQEQIMQIMHDLADIPWRTADMIRKVVSKSQGIEAFAKFKKQFVDGCIKKKTLTKDQADEMFKVMSASGAYAFNLSHSTVYSFLGYISMYFKVYYPLEFMLALLNKTGSDKHLDYIREARRLKLEVLTPDINLSEIGWSVKEGKIRSGFEGIKGVGTRSPEVIIKCRNAVDKFSDFKHFLENIDRKIVNRRVILALIKAGAFDLMEENRNISEAQMNGYTKDQMVYDLDEADELNKFNEGKAKRHQKMFKYVENFTEEQRMIQYEEVLPFEFNPDPLYAYKDMIKLLKNSLTINNILDADKSKIENGYFIGKMTEVKYGYREGADFAAGIRDNMGGVYGNFEDETSYIMLVFKTDIYLDNKELVEGLADKFILVKGSCSSKRSSLMASEVWLLDDIKDLNFDENSLQIKTVKQSNVKVLDCTSCNSCKLREVHDKPINTQRGDYNLMVVAESPGISEVRENNILIGKAGKLLFETFAKYGLERKWFYLSNCCRCCPYNDPKETKTPTIKQVDTCSSEWLDKEIKLIKPVVIFASGNTAKYFFDGKNSGIFDKNATAEWNKKYGCWVIFGIHPAGVLYHQENQVMLDAAVEKLAESVLKLM